MNQINTKEYWEERFSDKNWEADGGREQSIFFASVAHSAMPEFLKRELIQNSLTVLDIGCAEGDGTAYLAKQFPDCTFIGWDFSNRAIELAKEQYANCEFLVGDIYNELPSVDVIFSSNTLEHLKSPRRLMEKMCSAAKKYVILLLPFEDNFAISEHINYFSLDSFPINMGNSYLQFYSIVDCEGIEHSYWMGKQILLVYTSKEYRQERMTLLDVRQYYAAEERELIECAAKKYEEAHMALQNAKQKIDELSKQLLAEQKKYQNLYAYSAARDGELNRVQNSKLYKFFTKLRKPLHMGRVFIKALITLDFSTLKRGFTRPLKKLHCNYKAKKSKKRLEPQLKQAMKEKRVIVLPPSIDWNMPLFQRPQQLAGAYSRKDGVAVIYMTKASQYDHVEFAEQINSNLWLVNEKYLNNLPEYLEEAKEVVLSIHWTLNKHYQEILKPDKIIYEYIDELEIFYGYGPEMEQDHLRFLEEADVTVCTATKLYDQAVPFAKNPILSPNAGDYDFFSKTESYAVNPLIKDVVSGYKCILGYYGALASWFDYALIKEIAESHKDWLFLLIGVDYDGSIRNNGIEKYRNIVYIPPQPYAVLPSFLRAFDIAMIPFVINEITLSTSPVKLFEYMAAAKPIIASRMPECLKYESVKTYSNAEEFCAIVEKYMEMKSDDAYWNVLKKEALDNTWDARTTEILEALG